MSAVKKESSLIDVQDEKMNEESSRKSFEHTVETDVSSTGSEVRQLTFSYTADKICILL